MNKAIYLVVALAFLAIDMFAQNEILVVDSQSNEPIDMVYVATLRADSTMIDYTYTDEKGRCILAQNTQACFVSFSCLGFEAMILDAESLNDGTIVKLTQGQAFKLRNVTIKSERLTVAGDTLTYTVKGFSQPQDRSIADVIAKMPGLEVKENGAILFNGKPISKFYIEGMDMLDNKYALASKNIDYRKVRSVEVLQNHQKIAALRGKVFSENAALNLVLEDDARSTPIGKIELGSGYSDSNYDKYLFKTRLMSMLFSKKRQNLSLYKSTDLGQNLYSEILPIVMGDENLFTAIEPSLVSAISTPSSDLSSDKQTFNKAHLAAINELFRLQNESFMRVQANYFAERSKKDVQRNRIFHLMDDTKYIDSENLSNTDKLHHVDFSVNYERNASDCYLFDKMTGSLIWRECSGSFNNGTLNSSLDQQYFHNRFKFVKPLRQVTTLNIQSDLSFNGLPQQLSLYNGKQEKIVYTSHAASNCISLKYNIKNVFLTGQVGWNYKNQSILSEIDLINNIKEQEYVQSDLFASLNADYSKGKTKFSGSFMLHRLSVSLQENKYTHCYGDGRISTSYKVTESSNFTLSYNLQKPINDLRSQFIGKLWTDYKTTISYDRANDIERISTLNLNYTFMRPLTGTFIAANLNINQGKNLFAVENDFDNTHYKIHYAYLPNKYYGYGSYLRIGKTFSAWKTTIALTASSSKTHGSELINLRFEAYDSRQSAASLQYYARPTMWLSVECNSKWTYSDISSANWDFVRNKVSFDFNVTSPITESSEIGMKNTLTRLMEDGSNFFLSDLYYRYSRGIWCINFEVNNVFNITHYVAETISSTLASRTYYNIRPRELLVGFSLQL